MDLLKIVVLLILLQTSTATALEKRTCKSTNNCSWTAGLLLQYNSGRNKVYKIEGSPEFWSKMTCEKNRITRKDWTALAIYQMGRSDVVNAKIVCIGIPKEFI